MSSILILLLLLYSLPVVPHMAASVTMTCTADIHIMPTNLVKWAVAKRRPPGPRNGRLSSRTTPRRWKSKWFHLFIISYTIHLSVKSVEKEKEKKKRGKGLSDSRLRAPLGGGQARGGESPFSYVVSSRLSSYPFAPSPSCYLLWYISNASGFKRMPLGGGLPVMLNLAALSGHIAKAISFSRTSKYLGLKA